jgi:hypothetical protein
MKIMSDGQTGIVKIGSREYKTVALRVQEFREAFPLNTGWSLRSKIVQLDEDKVVIRASVVNPDGRVIGTGYAEEYRKAGKINATSALENCETSAIGRALAACGFGGSEYASANEVQGAIANQEAMAADIAQRAGEAVEKGDWLACCLIDKHDDPMWIEAWKKMGSKTRSRFKELQSIRDEFRQSLDSLADANDEPGFKQINDELNTEQAKYIYRLLSPEAQAMMANQRKPA